MTNDTKADDTERLELCPKCGERFNHWIDNGFRNTWPKGVDFEVCTTDESERMFVHTQNLRKATLEDWYDETDTEHGDSDD